MSRTRHVSSEAAARWLLERDRILILTHIRPDGDTLGSAAGLCQGLREQGKTVYILENRETTARYRDYVQPYLAPPGFAADHVVTVDTAAPELLAADAAGYSERVGLSIDHHPSNTGYAETVCLDPGRAACGEIVYDILMAMAGTVSAEAALPLYVALSTDTGCFAYANTTWETLTVAGALLKTGADNRAVNKKLFRTKSRARIAVDGELYTGMRYFQDGRIAVAVVTQEMLRRTGATEDDLDDVAAIPGQVAGVAVGITVKELADGTCKISVRTGPDLNAGAICGRFGGGGHRMAAGCVVALPPEEAAQALAAAAEEALAP